MDTGTPESTISAEFLDYALEVIQSDNDPNPVWDLVAAINLSEPEFSLETPLHIDIDTESAPGDTQGETIAVPGLSPNTLVSLDPSFENLDFTAAEVFSYLETIPIADTEVETVFGSVDDDLFDPGDLNSDFDGNNDILFAGSGDDLVDVSQAFGHNRIYAGSGDDILLAGSNNRLVGDSGEDILFVGMGKGNNTVTGGEDADQFWIVTDEDDLPDKANKITDFNRAEGDVIGLANTNLNFDDLEFRDRGSDTVIQAFGIDLAVLVDTEISQIEAADFVIV